MDDAKMLFYQALGFTVSADILFCDESWQDLFPECMLTALLYKK